MGIVIVIGIAVVALIAVQRGGASAPGSLLSIKASLSARTVPPIIGSYSNPVPTTNTQPIALPILGAGAAGGAGLATASLRDGSISTAGALTAGIGIVTAVIGALLAAHKARLAGATNENNAALRIVPVVDSFIAEVVSLFNSRQADAGSLAAAIVQFDQSVYNQLRSLVGAPGTSWSDAAGMAGQCDKSCTVGCCLYYSDLGPPLNDLSYALGYPTGKWGQGDPRLNGNTVNVPKVYPSRYSSYTRPAYQVTLQQ